MNLKTIIFSKNRAAQLGILLESLNLKSTVILTHDDDFKQGYVKLRALYPDVTFIPEINFKEQVIENLEEYTMFLVDDDIIIEPIDLNCKEFERFKNNEDILCLSFRLAPYYKNSPRFLYNENLWEWKGCYRSWGYPMSVSSTVFKKEDILPIMKKAKFNDPIELEVALRNNIPAKPFMLCCDKPYVINNLANQTEPKHSHYRTARQPLSHLEEMFLSGKKISLEKMRKKALKQNYCFMVEKYEWE